MLMGGACTKHDPAVTPIITEDSNPLSYRGHHLPSPPLQATITREDHPGLWAEQAPTMLHQSSLKTRTFCPTMQPSCVLTTDIAISPLLQSQAQEYKYHPYPKRLELTSHRRQPGSEEDPALMPAQGVMVARLRLFPLPDVAIPD